MEFLLFRPRRLSCKTSVAARGEERQLYSYKVVCTVKLQSHLAGKLSITEPRVVIGWLLHILVAVNFLSQVIYIFLLFLGMVMYANELERKEKYNNITWDEKLTTTYFSHA